MSAVDYRSVKPWGPRDAGISMTMAEFERAEYEPGYRYELIQGVLVVTPPPLEEERDINQVLGHWLLGYQECHPAGSALDLTLPEHNVPTKTHNRRADRVIWAGLGRHPRTRGDIKRRDVPTIVLEISSSRPADQRRDYEEKRIEYRDVGVQEYWIIDRFRRVLIVHRWRGKRWTGQTIKENEIYHTPLLPGFELPLGKLLTVADKYRQRSTRRRRPPF